jgi:hypothetical protein
VIPDDCIHFYIATSYKLISNLLVLLTRFRDFYPGC